ncbi:serine hydrolase domain-containing protein [Nocardiopsis coralliicola]
MPSPTLRLDTGFRRLRTELDRIARRRSRSGLPPPQVLVRTPAAGFAYGSPSRIAHPASTGKLFTATLVAALVERRLLDFDSPIGRLLPAADTAGLPAVPGTDPAAEVTVEHLLAHTSGLPDYSLPPRGFDTECSERGVARDRDRVWRPADLLEQTRRLPATGRPGGRMHYADTNYVLLGRIAEEAAGERLGDLLRTVVFAPAGMASATSPFDPAVRPQGPAGLGMEPFWMRGAELSTARSMSADWGCGGVAAAPADLVRFQQALHGGELISRANLEFLLRPRNRMRRGIHYGAGAMTVRFGEFAPPLLRGLPEPVGHSGIWAAHLYYYPRQDAHVFVNFHSTRQMGASFLLHARIARLLAAAP